MLVEPEAFADMSFDAITVVGVGYSFFRHGQPQARLLTVALGHDGSKQGLLLAFASLEGGFEVVWI